MQDNLNILKNISSSNIDNSSNTIIASMVLLKDKMLLNGKIISSNENQENDLIKFDQINIDLANFKNTTIKEPKIQETSTLNLYLCLIQNYPSLKICENKL